MDHQMGIQLYGFWRSLASYRVRVALKLKELPFEEIPVDILSGEQFSPDYQAVNAERVVPTLIHDGNTVFQSLVWLIAVSRCRHSPPLTHSSSRAIGPQADSYAPDGHYRLNGFKVTVVPCLEYGDIAR